MHIEGWHVDGFGILRDHEVRGLGGGLTAFVGPNEAGKSTLLAFLRGVLVGYPAKGAAAHYPPLNGGDHGGRVFLRGPGGEVIVERMVSSKVPRVVFPDRIDRGDEVVRRLLGGVDAGLFNSVFAFSLTELQDLRSLTEEGVRDRIFSAGIAGAGRSARQAAVRLEKEASELLRPRKGGLVNELMDRLAKAETLVSDARSAASRYPQLLEAEAQASGAVEAAQAEARSLRDSLRRHELLQELWPAYYDGEEARKELESLGPLPELPDDPEERLARVTMAAASAAELVTGLEAEAAEARRALEAGRSALRADLEAHAPRVDELVAAMGVYQDRVASFPEAHASAVQASETAARNLAALGQEWDEDRLRALDVSLPRAEEVREWGVRLTASAAALDALRRDRDTARARVREAEGERDRLSQRLHEADSAEDDSLPVQESALRRLRADAQESEALAARIVSLRGLADARERSLRAAESMAAPGGVGSVAGVLGLLAVLAIAAGLVLGWLLDPLWIGILGAPGAALGIGAYFAWRLPARGGNAEAEMAGLREAIEAGRAELASVEARVEAVGSRMDADAETVGLASRPGFVEIEARMDVLEVARDRRRARDGLRAREKELEETSARAADSAAQADSLFEQGAAEDGRLREGWQAWKTGLGVPLALGAEGVAEFLRAARAAQGALVVRAEAAGRSARLRDEIEAWEAKVRAVLRDAGRGGEGTGGAIVPEFKRLQEACAADRTQRERCGEQGAALERLEGKLAVAREALSRAEAACASLFRESGVEDEAAFRARIALAEMRRRLEERVAGARRVLETRLGHGREAGELREELALGRVEAWAAEAERLSETSTQAESKATEGIRLHRDAERNRQALEESSDVAACELQLGGTRAQLDVALRRWQVVAAARVLIEETLAEYSRTRQPPVLKEASIDFAGVTGGAYTQIIERDDAEGFVVLDDCGGIKAPENLSRGTLEQLYLSLRLGLAAEFARRAGPVPVIMDDVLVNFDPVRARATAEVLVSFAMEHQVLFFTCHPSTVELLRQADGGVSVVELGRGTHRQTALWEG